MSKTEENKIPYAIIRVGKIKTFSQLWGYQKHVNREVETENADVSRTEKNYIMRGGDDVVNRVKEFMKKRNLEVTGVGTQNQSVLCTEMLITASPEFFRNEDGTIDMQLAEKWAFENDKWLKDNYGENYLFSKVHMDETSPHISIIIQPTSFHKKYNREVLAHKKWFGKDKGKGYNKLKDLQEEYPKAMQEAGFNLQRGQAKSTAKHQDVQSHYGKINDFEQRVQIEVIESQNLLIEQHTKEVNNLKKQLENQKIEINARNELINRVGEAYDIQDQLKEAYPLAKQRAIDKANGIDVDKKSKNKINDADDEFVDGLPM